MHKSVFCVNMYLVLDKKSQLQQFLLVWMYHLFVVAYFLDGKKVVFRNDECTMFVNRACIITLTPCCVTLLTGVRVLSFPGKCFLILASSEAVLWSSLSAVFSRSISWPIIWPLRTTCSLFRPRSCEVWMVRGWVASLSNVSVFSTDVFSCKSQLLLVIYDSCCVYR